ncbi:MAG: cyclic nucleotide-binding domain-containing protein [Gammaproteobacteria bacterium]|nr:cyclic nucleotide-binding domain-containing protein [Gammaproteobacteria bacterium]
MGYAKIDRPSACQRCSHAPYCLPSQVPHTPILLNDFQFPSRALKRGEHLCYQGEYLKNLYIIRAGLLKSTITKKNGEEYIMGFYFPPDLFGWEGIDEMHRSIAITAIDQSNICVIPTEKMFSLTQQIPTLGTQLLKMISHRIHQDNIALLRHLLMTHQDIANYLRITPNTISRIFHAWQKKKLIQIERHLIYLLDIPNIVMIAEMDETI